jgi:hypothetical protein
MCEALSTIIGGYSPSRCGNRDFIWQIPPTKNGEPLPNLVKSSGLIAVSLSLIE